MSFKVLSSSGRIIQTPFFFCLFVRKFKESGDFNPKSLLNGFSQSWEKGAEWASDWLPPWHCHIPLDESSGRVRANAAAVVSYLFLLLLRNKPSKPSTRASRQNGKEETAAGTRWVCLIQLKEESDQNPPVGASLRESKHFTKPFSLNFKMFMRS